MRPLRFTIFFVLTLTLLAPLASNAGDEFDEAGIKWDATSQSTEKEFDRYETGQEKSWDEMRQRVLRKWSDAAMPQQKIYVVYSEGDSARAKIDYENGTAVIEVLVDSKNTLASAREAEAKIKRTLSTLVSDDNKSTTAALTEDDLAKPTEALQGVIKYIALKDKTISLQQGSDGHTRSMYQLTLELIPGYIQRRAAKYRPLVEFWANKYKLDPAFVLAIIRQESAFNPRAFSRVGAIGLMQIFPPYAGKDVLKAVTGNASTPTSEFLYDPKNSIMMGTTFLQILRDRNFANIKDKEKQRYLIICAYNWSASRLLKAISNGRLLMNLPAPEVFDRLEQIIPSETKDYLKRVTKFTQEFRGE